jgi:GT2 family glycosyltransferase
MRLSVVVPVHNGGEGLRLCLQALAASARPPDEVIVVDDGSTDGSAALAAALAARVLTTSAGPRGPAHARNRGAEAATGEVLVFIDADVAVHADTLARMEALLAGEPNVAAVFGCYDDHPPAHNPASLYKNLLHHYVHQHGAREAGTFWSGCGAVRRAVFRAASGFDEGYTRPSIEDIELGARLRQAGHRIRLCPEIQATHLKRWTLASLWRTDIFGRAVPWTRLILRQGRLSTDLNLDWRSRLSALAAWALLASMLLLLAFGLLGLERLVAWGAGELCSPRTIAGGMARPSEASGEEVVGGGPKCGANPPRVPISAIWPGLGVLLASAGVTVLNADLYRFFFRRGGARFTLIAAALHVAYLFYSSLVFVCLLVSHRLRGSVGRSREPTIK